MAISFKKFFGTNDGISDESFYFARCTNSNHHCPSVFISAKQLDFVNLLLQSNLSHNNHFLRFQFKYHSFDYYFWWQLVHRFSKGLDNFYEKIFSFYSVKYNEDKFDWQLSPLHILNDYKIPNSIYKLYIRLRLRINHNHLVCKR